MARQRVFLHIGSPKTGTTYLQEVLWSNRDALREAGVLYPGDRHDAHFLATQDLRELVWHGHVDPAVPGAWDRLVTEVRNWPGTSIISHEMLGSASPAAIKRALQSLAGLEVHVLLTTRDLARQVPAVWQEDVKNCGMLTFGEFTRSLRGLDDSIDPFFARTFWSYQDLPVVLRNWAGDLPAERVHVVTVPRGAARDELWQRFAKTVGADPANRPVEVDVRNPSMGVVETNVVRRVNELVVKDLPWPVYQRLVKNLLAVNVLAARPGAVPLRLPAEDQDWVLQKSKEMAQALREAGYEVTGDLDDLLPATGGPEPRHPDDVGDAETLDAAIYALAGLLHELEAERERAAEEREALVTQLVPRPFRWAIDRYRDARVRIHELRTR
ncbi:MAG TPA: hypothetical protein VH969_14710 [Actinophytocola sp.]|uniref:hypothetical protein n=1 Tax=Actinophytocola sp. TaxID=1872138 RepID=UPI002F92A0D4